MKNRKTMFFECIVHIKSAIKGTFHFKTEKYQGLNFQLDNFYS